jgi:hypothetical protein
MKKTNMKIGLLTLVLLTTMTLSAQNMSVGLALKGSTMGLGGDVVFQFHERMTARLGYDALGYSRTITFEEQDIEYNADLSVKTGSITALYDFYLAKSIFVSAGFGLNNFNINAVGAAASDLPYGDVTIPADKIGNFEFNIVPSMKISPYLGLGFGRTLGKESKVGFAFELGTYYMGSPDVSVTSSGLIAPTSNPAFGQEALFERQFSQYNMYPVMKFSLSYKIASF